jgi:hypothetical protein
MVEMLVEAQVIDRLVEQDAADEEIAIAELHSRQLPQFLAVMAPQLARWMEAGLTLRVDRICETQKVVVVVEANW